MSAISGSDVSVPGSDCRGRYVENMAEAARILSQHYFADILLVNFGQPLPDSELASLFNWNVCEVRAYSSLHHLLWLPACVRLLKVPPSTTLHVHRCHFLLLTDSHLRTAGFFARSRQTSARQVACHPPCPLCPLCNAAANFLGLPPRQCSVHSGRHLHSLCIHA